MSKELKALEEMLTIRRLRTAMRKEDDLETARTEAEEAGTDCDLHLLVLVPIDISNPALIYIHPQRFLNELKELGQTLNLQTLLFKDIVEEVADPVPPPEKEETEKKSAEELASEIEKEVKEPETDEAKDKDIPGLDKMETYTKEELEKMSKADLLKIAGPDPDVNTKGNKAELIEKLTGRPKFPLA